jgi:hypothetical protein
VATDRLLALSRRGMPRRLREYRFSAAVRYSSIHAPPPHVSPAHATMRPCDHATRGPCHAPRCAPPHLKSDKERGDLAVVQSLFVDTPLTLGVHFSCALSLLTPSSSSFLLPLRHSPTLFISFRLEINQCSDRETPAET